jgi:hypothetical protein
VEEEKTASLFYSLATFVTMDEPLKSECGVLAEDSASLWRS